MTLVVPFENIFKDQTKLLAKHESWERVELGEVCEILNGFAFKSTLFNKSEGFPVIRIRDLARGRTETLYKGDYPREYVVENGDFLIGMDGNFGCYEWNGGQALINQRVCKITPNENYMRRKFLLFGINGYLKAIQDATSSVTVGHLSSRDIEKIPFPLPPLNEQRRIVAKLEKLLSRVDAAQARLATVPRILKQFRQSTLAAAFSGVLTDEWRKLNQDIETGSQLLNRIRKDRINQELSSVGRRKLTEFPKPFIPESFKLFQIPNTWTWASLAEIGEIVTGKTPSKKSADFWDGNILFVMPEDLSKAEECINLRVVTKTTNYVTAKGLRSVQHLERPAVLVCCIGTLGRVGIVKQKAAFSQQLNAVIPHPEINLEYLAFYCHTIEPILRELWPHSTYMPIVNKTLFSSVPVPVPPLQEQEALVGFLRQKLSEQSDMEKRGAKAKSYVDKLTQSILARALRGELVTTEAELARQEGRDYEPASVLLERIRQERAQQQESAGSKSRRKPRGKKDTVTKKMFA